MEKAPKSQRVANDTPQFGDTLRFLEVYLHINVCNRGNAKLPWVSVAGEPDRRVDNRHQQDANGEHRGKYRLAKGASAAWDRVIVGTRAHGVATSFL